MNNFTNQDRARRSELLQARFARRVASQLTQRVTLDARPDIDERLRVAREQAVERARAQRRLAPAGGPIAMGGGTLALGGPGGDAPWWLRLSPLLPLAVLLAGLLLIDHQYTQSQIQAAAEVDAALLADDLPPEAYSDPGFAEFLKTSRP
jgi:Protein of unknown function (DUF3619)